MDKNTQLILLLGGAATALAFVLLSRPNGALVTAVANPAEPQMIPGFSVPPLDLSALLGTIGNVPVQTGTGLSFPPILGGANEKGCCNECSPADASNAAYNVVNSLNLGPLQPLVDTSMLTPLERSAIDLGVGQIVFDPSSARGFYVATFSGTYAGSPREGVVYNGGASVLPNDGRSVTLVEEVSDYVH